jgi:hypothetical protein
MVYVGIDNGTSSNGIGIVVEQGKSFLYPTPIKKEKSYTKVEKNISRIDHKKMLSIFKELLNDFHEDDFLIGLERPMVNPGRFFASMSAMRALESTLIVLETLELNFIYLDSKEWQRVMLPGSVGGKDLKIASLAVGKSLFPHIKFKGDADGILIAEYLRIKNNKKL